MWALALRRVFIKEQIFYIRRRRSFLFVRLVKFVQEERIQFDERSIDKFKKMVTEIVRRLSMPFLCSIIAFILLSNKSVYATENGDFGSLKLCPVGKKLIL